MSPPESGWHNWIDIEADPNNPRHLIACGDKWSPRTNSLFGFLYASFDAGRSWQLVVTDDSSSWVSEESCAFGPNGRAYFIAGVSKVLDGQPHHELGRTHFYRSEDAGRTWSVPLVWAQWADFTSTTVDNTQGTYGGRVYVFYNEPIRDEKGAYHTQIRLLYSDDGGKTLKGPAASAVLEGVRLRAAYPARSKVLSNGSAVVIFRARRESVQVAGATAYNTTEVVTSEDGGKTLAAPGLIMRTTGSLGCSSDPTMAVDESKGPFDGRIYVAEANASAGCQVALSSSSDKGKTWLEPTLVTIADAGSLLNLSIGVNRDGVIGVAWAKREGDCWRFSASTDGGASFLPSVPLSPCAVSSSPGLQLLNHFLWSVPFDDREPRRGLLSSSAAFSMRAPVGVVWKTNMAVSSDGLFHPIWMDTQGQIWTASVSVGEDLSRNPLPALTDLDDVSSDTIFDLANNHFDATTSTVSVDVGIMIRTTSKAALRGPVVMQITDLNSEFGSIEILNSDNGKSGVGAIFDFSDLMPPEPLAPGAISLRRRFLFRISEPKRPATLYPDLLIVKAKVFGKPVSRE